MHIIATLESTELSTDPYGMLDDCTRMNLVRLNKGELVIWHPIK